MFLKYKHAKVSFMYRGVVDNLQRKHIFFSCYLLRMYKLQKFTFLGNPFTYKITNDSICNIRALRGIKIVCKFKLYVLFITKLILEFIIFLLSKLSTGKP